MVQHKACGEKWIAGTALPISYLILNSSFCYWTNLGCVYVHSNTIPFWNSYENFSAHHVNYDVSLMMPLKLIIILHCFKILNVCNYSNYLCCLILVVMVIYFSRFIFFSCKTVCSSKVDLPNVSQWYPVYFAFPKCYFKYSIWRVFSLFSLCVNSVHPSKTSQCQWLQKGHSSHKSVSDLVSMLFLRKKIMNLHNLFGSFYMQVYLILLCFT